MGSLLRLALLRVFLFSVWQPPLGIGSKYEHNRHTFSSNPLQHRRFLQEQAPDPSNPSPFHHDQEIFLPNLPPAALPQESPSNRSLLFARAKFQQSSKDRPPCSGAARHHGFPTPFAYALEHDECQSGGLIEYIQIFYCVDVADHHRRLKTIVAFLAISLWLAALFYMLGSTAADYFCSCLERLSQLLRLPPTVAGVTLLPLGNGAADVFASVASFAGSHNGGAVGINSVLGGAVFVVTVVTGLVNILVSSGENTPSSIDGRCFFRDGIFFLASLGYLAFVLWKGSVTVVESLGYLGIYVVYALVVAVWEVWRARWVAAKRADEECGGAGGGGGGGGGGGEYARLPASKDEASGDLDSVITVPPWLWTVYTKELSIKDKVLTSDGGGGENNNPSNAGGGGGGGGGNGGDQKMTRSQSLLKLGRKASRVLIKWPLNLPRRYTIPIVDESRWSRPRAVIAATLAPILVIAVWSAENGSPIIVDVPWLVVGIVGGIALGVTAYFTTVDERPPQGQGAAPLVWITAGFFMSMVWFYVIARELVAALVSLAALLGIDAAVLGVTLLAWGNSMGDLVANSALASRGGDAGVQIAIAGCYAGPMFNTLFGLGVSFLIVAVQSHSGVYVIPGTAMAMLTVAFLTAAILLAMAGMAVRKMRLSRPLGVALIVLYGGFMVVRACDSLGLSLV